MVERPLLRCFPRADRAFQREVDRLFDAWVATSAGRSLNYAAFQEEIRRHYPTAFVRPREALASLSEIEQVWYVHRRDEPAAIAPEALAGSAPQPAEGDTAGTTAAPPTGLARVTEGPGSTPTYSANRVAEMVGVPISVIVSWDEAEGIVRPARTSGGIALYSRNDVEELLMAKRAFAAGRSTDEVRSTLAGFRGGTRPRVVGEAAAGKRLLVLLAEKDPYAAEFSEYFLRTEGYEVEVALAAGEAEARAAELLPDVAVVELLISGGAGAELCARLKTRPEAKVLAISSLDMEDAALRAGADAFIRKPYEALAFVSAIKDLLGESAMLTFDQRRDQPPRAAGGAR